MRASKNRRVFIAGYELATPLGENLTTTWERAVNGETGFTKVTRCKTSSLSNVVGEIPSLTQLIERTLDKRDVYNWNARYVGLTVAVIKGALENAGISLNEKLNSRTACLIGSALNGTDAYRVAMNNYENFGPTKVSPYLLPNLCANLPSGKAGMMLGFKGPIFSPQGACASGNYAIGIGARMIRDGDCDIALVGGVDTCLVPEIIQGFANMWASIRVTPEDRAYHDPKRASRPFSIDRRGIVLSEGAGVLVLAAEELMDQLNLIPKAEVAGIGWTSDAFHFTSPNQETIVHAIHNAMDDAEITPHGIDYVNAHGTSTPKGDQIEIECLKSVFGDQLFSIPISSNKSQIGHTLGASAAIEAILGVEGMQRGVLLPTANHIPDPELGAYDFVPNEARFQRINCFLSNAFGFGGTNCCVVFKGVVN